MRPHRARALWAEAVGDPISRVTVAEKVRGRVLFVRTTSSVWANELTFYKADILRKLNAMLEGSVLDDIHFQSGAKIAKRADAAAPKAPSEEDLAVDCSDPVGALLGRAARARDWKRGHGWLSCKRCETLYPPETPVKRRENGLCPLCRMQAGST
jgi:hypothetical protein